MTAIGALLFTGVSVQQTRSQVHLAAQGQVSERFGTSVEQLNSRSLGVRLGGIYALERLARDSPADQPTVVEVLSAFIREHARDELTPVWVLPHGRYLRPAADVRTALTVLSRRDQRQDNGITVDLQGANLADLDLAGFHLPGARFDHTDLTGANLREANLAGASFTQTEACGANLKKANLTGADLSDADLAGALMRDTDLSGAVLRGADLRWTALYDAHLDDADLVGALTSP